MTSRREPERAATNIGRSLRTEIVAALAFKALALLLLYVAFFGGAHRAHVTAEKMTAALTRGASNAR